jgi:hypothetical protein
MAAGPRYMTQHGPNRKCISYYCVFSRCRGNDLSSELFPSNGCSAVTYLHGFYLDITLRVAIMSSSTLSSSEAYLQIFSYHSACKLISFKHPFKLNNVRKTIGNYEAAYCVIWWVRQLLLPDKVFQSNNSNNFDDYVFRIGKNKTSELCEEFYVLVHGTL